MTGYVSGSLEQMLKIAQIVWYQSESIHVYLEQPHIQITGQIGVNGIKIVTLIDDGSNMLSLNLQNRLLERGVRLDQDWYCQQQVQGSGLSEALSESNCGAAKHQDGTQIQLMDDQKTCTIFVHEVKYVVDIALARGILGEWGIHLKNGWFPMIIRKQIPAFR